uniref:Calcium-activated potassium channel subunit beta n=1 Tax=Nannospalax galili TaxID=1026970 RepID=A0A8C6RWN9_NANGA
MQPFSIPVQITLQGSQRRQGRTALPASGRRSGDPLPWHPKLPSSAGEDRAMLLGVTMMGSSVMMFLLLGTTILKPSELSPQREESNCTTVRTHIVDWSDSAFTCEVDCRGQGRYPCLQVLVNLTHSGHKALLHYDEEAAEANPKCFYTPRCPGDKDDLLSSALGIKEFFDHRNGTPFACFYSPRHPKAVVLVRSDQAVVFHCLLWPSATLLGGALIVGMVRLTQHLSLLCQQSGRVGR